MIDKIKLDNYEKKIEKNISNYKKAPAQKISKIEEIIRIANEKRNISLRVNRYDLDQLKTKAEKEGIPYQTLISSVIHKFITNQLVDQESIIKGLRLLKTR